MLSFIIVIFSIVEKVDRVKRQYLTFYMLIFVGAYCVGMLYGEWAAIEYIKKGPLATRITTHHLVRTSLYYCQSVFFVFDTPFVSLRSTRNVKSYLVRSKIYPHERKVGSEKCSSKRCLVCLNVSETDVFQSFQTKKNNVR